ncbi:hypothetical protein OGAPHI_005843 [Ogataea philodendri]|uniref:Secreted protein n=1 Tax=Ogataea philodendri TaxID=1378263 RepID=A0A9P8P0D1_9ASCO|nr:uncharacterized protein OGAPHI_005843 [Ogataea philodendri]KAH3662591.1 hypothetical protein OGAPHI_005843 [Ogataea philodendri]
MGRIRNNRNAQILKLLLHVSDILLLANSVLNVLSHDSDGGGGSGHQSRRQSRGEDESWSKRPDPVHHLTGGCNIATNSSKRLTQSTGDDINTVHHGGVVRRSNTGFQVGLKVQMFGNTSSMRTVHTDGMDLVQESESTVLVGQITDLLNRSNRTTHGVDTLKRNQFWSGFRVLSQHGLQLLQIVVFEDVLSCSGVADSHNHRRMVQSVRENDQIFEFLAQQRKNRIVGNKTRREHQGTLLFVQSSQLGLQSNCMSVMTSNVPGSAGTGTIFQHGGVHGFQDLLVLTHSQIIVGTPDHHLVVLLGQMGLRELLGESVDVVEEPVRLVLSLFVHLLFKSRLVVKARLVRRLVDEKRVGRLGRSSGTWQGVAGLSVKRLRRSTVRTL